MTRRADNPGSERGQTMVEFALVAPILLILLFAAIQFGILYNNYVTLTDAVRTGARKAAVSRSQGNPAAVTEAQVRASASDLKQSDLLVTVQAPAGWSPGGDVTVEATYPYSVNLLGVHVKSGRLSSRTTERLE